MRVAQRGESRISGRRPEQAVTAADHSLVVKRPGGADARRELLVAGAATGRGVAIDPCVHDAADGGRAQRTGGFLVEADDELVIPLGQAGFIQ